MGPSSIDAEIRSLGPSAGGDIKLLELFMLFIERQIGSRRDFEFSPDSHFSEEIWGNGGFTLKTRQMFSAHRKIGKRNNHRSFSICV